MPFQTDLKKKTFQTDIKKNSADKMQNIFALWIERAFQRWHAIVWNAYNVKNDIQNSLVYVWERTLIILCYKCKRAFFEQNTNE